MKRNSKIRLFLLLTGCCLVGCGEAPTSSASAKPRTTEPKDQKVASQPLTTRTKPDSVANYHDFVKANFAGDAACQSCHPTQYAAHQRSGHSHTATLMAESDFAARLLKMQRWYDPARKQTFSFRKADDQFMVKLDDDNGPLEIPVTWLLGSGTHAQTPVAVDETHQVGVEMRFSYFAHQDHVGVTPDQERFDQYRPESIECFGRPMKGDVLECLGCHMTLGPPPGAPWLREMFVPNVGCERCHGPRQKHVELAKVGRGAEIVPMIEYRDAASYVTACANCHRDESSVQPDADPKDLARFQPYGLRKSRCFQQTPGNMSCANCHDPHDAASTNRPQYIESCRSCHQPQKFAECPTMPTGDCIDCHMPAVEWMSGIKFHDHWIRKPQDVTNGEAL